MIPTSLGIFFLGIIGILFYFSFQFFNKSLKEKNRLAQSLQLVNELAIDMASITDLDRLLPSALNAFIKAGNIHKGSLMILNEECGILEIRAVAGITDPE